MCFHLNEAKIEDTIVYVRLRLVRAFRDVICYVVSPLHLFSLLRVLIFILFIFLCSEVKFILFITDFNALHSFFSL